MLRFQLTITPQINGFDDFLFFLTFLKSGLSVINHDNMTMHVPTENVNPRKYKSQSFQQVEGDELAD